MGGTGSGRSGAGPTVESAAKIGVYGTLQGRDRPSADRACLWTWSNTCSGEITRRLVTIATLEAATPHVTFCHLGSDDYRDIVYRYRVDLTSTTQPLGGRRWWFVCPRAGYRVAALYLPNGATRFASAEAYRLGYRSQRSTARDRAIARTHKIRRRLGADVNPLVEVEKPHRMRWATFAREMQRLEIAEGRSTAFLVKEVERLEAMNRGHR